MMFDHFLQNINNATFKYNIKHCLAYSARNFAKSSFSDVMKFLIAGLPMV